MYFTLVGLTRKALRQEFGEQRIIQVLAQHGHVHSHPKAKIAKGAKTAKDPKLKRSADPAKRRRRNTAGKKPKPSHPRT